MNTFFDHFCDWTLADLEVAPLPEGFHLAHRPTITHSIGVVATDKGPIASWLRGSTFVVRRYQNLEALLDDHQLSRPRFVVSAEGMAGCGLYSELLVAREQGQGIMVSKVRPSERATSPDHRFVGQELNANLQAQIDRGLEAPCPLDLLDRDVVRAMSLCVWA